MSMTNSLSKADYNKHYNSVNKDKIALRKKQNYEATKARCAEIGKTYYEAHKVEQRATQKKYRSTEKGKKAKKRAALKLCYGLPLESYQAMYDTQNGCCKICGEFQLTLHVDHDHDHATNKVRALLCGLCNTALGGFKDNIVNLTNAIHYLNEHESK